MNPAHPRNERARKRMWAQHGPNSTLDFGNHTIFCSTCARSPETLSLNSERAHQTLIPCPKSYVPSQMSRTCGEHRFDRMLGHRPPNPNPKMGIRYFDGNGILSKLYKMPCKADQLRKRSRPSRLAAVFEIGYKCIQFALINKVSRTFCQSPPSAKATPNKAYCASALLLAAAEGKASARAMINKNRV